MANTEDNKQIKKTAKNQKKILENQITFEFFDAFTIKEIIKEKPKKVEKAKVVKKEIITKKHKCIKRNHIKKFRKIRKFKVRRK